MTVACIMGQVVPVRFIKWTNFAVQYMKINILYEVYSYLIKYFTWKDLQKQHSKMSIT